MPLETSWMPMACVMAVSSDSGHIHHVSYHSQETQATITTSAIGTQSLPMFFSTSCQTEEEFSVLETENAQAGASEKFPAAQDGADIVAEAHLHACSQLHSGSTGSFSTISEKVLGKRKLCFCPSSQQCYHQSTHGKVYARSHAKKRCQSAHMECKERLNGRSHFIYKLPGGSSKDCAVCSNRKTKGGRRETVFFCKTCSNNPGLHPGECFKRFHTELKYR
ncbi:uncharacterized protein LOC144158704 isoform X4 [Haemaphysalis longicornis]